MGLSVAAGSLAPAAVTTAGVVRFLGQWIFVPVMFAFLLAFAVYLARQPTETVDQQRANLMGLVMGGVCILAVIVLDSLGMWREMAFLTGENRLANLVVGGLAGFGLLAISDKFLTMRTRSFFVMPVSAVSVLGIYFYFTNDAYRNAMLLLLVGLLVGLALYAWLFSTVFQSLLGAGPDARARRAVAGRRR